jgi:uncharacterized membrane protein
MRRFHLLLKVFAASSAAGVLFALAAAYIHFQLDQSGLTASATSSQVNCDVVLTSRFAKIFEFRWRGLPSSRTRPSPPSR